jgi:type I restriction enzyme M protein
VKNFSDKVNFIWSVADLLRGPYRPNQYGRVILPLTVLRRLDCVLEPTKNKVLKKFESLSGGKVGNVDPILNRAAGVPFHNTSKLTFARLKDDPSKIASNLASYIKSFSMNVREIFERFGFEEHITKLDDHNRLFLVVSKFCDMPLHPDVVPNIEMGYIFEELIRRFSEAANETAGDHFTPREVIRLMVNLLFQPDSDILTRKGIVKTMLDPASGTGGILAGSDEYLHELNPEARLEAFGQDYNPESYAICSSDMLIKGHNIDHIVFGDSFTHDGFYGQQFDYMATNPPFGVEWKPEEDFVRREHEQQGFSGRFGAGLPRINDGSLLFLQHMISKMKAADKGGTRLAIVFNGSPLFTGDAGSGESEIRRWIIENDWLDAIIALPDQLFYNTGIFTYVWIVTNRKTPERRGKIQLINAVGFYRKMRKSLNNKRNEISDEHIAEITRIYGDFATVEHAKIFDNQDFGFQKITVERPLRLDFQVTTERIGRLFQQRGFAGLATSKKKKGSRAAEQEIEAGRKQQEEIIEALVNFGERGAVGTGGKRPRKLQPGEPVWVEGRLYKDRNEFVAELDAALAMAEVKVSAPIKKAILAALSERDETAKVCTDKNGNPEPDPELRDYENVPLKEDIHEYFEREVRPHVPDAWIDESKTKIGYEIPLNRHFYKYQPPRPLEEIEGDIAELERDIVRMLREVVGEKG